MKMTLGIGGVEEDNEVGALKEALRKAHNEGGALKEALKKAHLLLKALRKMGTINTAEKEALWDAEDAVRQLTKTISIKEGRNANKEARLKKTETRLRKVNAKSDAESRRQAEELRKLEAEKHVMAEAEENDALRKAEKKALQTSEAEKEVEALRKTDAKVNNQVMACFPSVEEILKDMYKKGGRDPFVADLANNHGSTNYTTGIHEGVIYAIICRVDLNIYVGQSYDAGKRMRSHFSEGGGSNSNLTSAMNEHGREKFVTVILLAGIKEKQELDSAEIALIETLITLSGKTGYNIQHVDIIGRDGIMRYSCKAVVITILDTGSELYFNNSLEAAKGMGVSDGIIVLLVNNNSPYKSWNRSHVRRWKCKSGKYFTARYALIAREGRQ